MQALASSAAKSKAALNKDRVTIIDTAQILAGRSNSGVTITPAAGNRLTGSHAYAGMSEKLPLPGNLAASLASSGVTISSKTTQLPGGHLQNVQAAAVKPETHSIPGSNFVYDSKGQLQDPNLTDDTIVIEVNIGFYRQFFRRLILKNFYQIDTCNAMPEQFAFRRRKILSKVVVIFWRII